MSWEEVWAQLPDAFLPYLVVGVLVAALVEWSIRRKLRGAPSLLLDEEDEIEDDSPPRPFTRLWLRATIAYFAAAVLALYLYLQGDWDWGLPPLFALALFAPIFVSLGLLAIYTDEFQIRHHTFYRRKSPIAYWLCVAMILAAGAVMILAGIAHAAQSKADDYDVLLRSTSLTEEREALAAILEEQLIEMAGPTTPPGYLRLFAASALQESVATSKNRIAPLPATNERRSDAAQEYRGAIYEAIYRAEIAKARGR